MHTILHALASLVVQCVIAMNIHYYQRSKLGDRSKTQQHLTLSQSSSKPKNTRQLVKTGK